MAEYFTKEGDEFKKVDAFSQEQLDEINGETGWLNKRLERERSKFADYDELKERAGKVDSIKAEYEEKLTAATAAQAEFDEKLKKANLETEKVKISSEFKLKPEMSEFLTATDPAELRKQAEKLSKGGTGANIPAGKENKPPSDGDNTSKTLAGNLFGRKSKD